MKTKFCFKSLWPTAVMAMLAISLLGVRGAEDGQTNTTAEVPKPDSTPVTQTSASPVLSAGVDDVLKLSRAKLGDSTIRAFINNSGIGYYLSASEIVYLREQGLSDQVITTMLEQRKNLNGAALAATQLPDSSTNQPQAYALPTTTVVHTAPSTVYVYRDYPVYDDWWYPSVSLGFVFGGGWYGGGYHGWDNHSHSGGYYWGGNGNHGSRGSGGWGGGGGGWSGGDGGSRGGGSMGGSRGGSGGPRGGGSIGGSPSGGGTRSGGGSGSMGGSRSGGGGGGSRGGSRR